MPSQPSVSAALQGLTMRFAQHVATLRYEDLPEDVVGKAKLIIRDGIGNQVAASGIAEPAARMVELVREWGGAPESTVVGYGIKVPAPHAALCNAMMGHGVELDDAHGTGLIKSGSVLMPSVFAIAEKTHSSGREIIAAVVAAYDMAVRIARAINPGHRQRGYHTTGTVSVFGAAAACARLLGCSVEQIASALGLAGIQSAGIQAFLDDSCMAKPFSPGKSAFNGVIAALMASRGFTGPKKVLESREGFLNAFTSAVDEKMLDNALGKHFSIMEVGFKPHAACRYAHGPLDLAQAMYREDGVRLADVEGVNVGMSELAIRQASKSPCANLNVAMGSTEFGVALALTLGANGLREYWQGFKMQEVHDAAARRVKLRAEPEFGLGGRQAMLEIKLANGKTLRRRQEEPKGEPTNPLSPEELERKFYGMTGMVADDATARRISDAIMALDEVKDAAVIPPLTVSASGKPALRAA
jgi:2-methylcitrate dehydratase PrpD